MPSTRHLSDGYRGEGEGRDEMGGDEEGIKGDGRTWMSNLLFFFFDTEHAPLERRLQLLALVLLFLAGTALLAATLLHLLAPEQIEREMESNNINRLQFQRKRNFIGPPLSI